MGQVNTVRGPVDAGALGRTLMHEHVFVVPRGGQQLPDGVGPRHTRVAEAIERLNELKSRGVDTIVDLTVIGLGRDIADRPEVRGTDRAEHRRRDRPLHLQRLPFCFHYRSAGAPTEPWTCRHVRPRHRGGHRRHRQSRRASSSAPPTSPASPRVSSGCCARSPRCTAHRGADLHTHPRGTRRGLEQQRIFDQKRVST